MTSSNLNWSLEYYEKNTEECNTVLNSLENYEKIPEVDINSLQTLMDGTLVRYRGMIQDMLNPEYYSCNFTVVNKESKETYVKSGKFRDIASCKGNEELNLKESDFSPKERLVFFCIPIPGTNDWVHACQEKSTAAKQDKAHSSGLKRGVSEVDAEMEMDAAGSTSENTIKRNKPSGVKSEASIPNTVFDKNHYLPISNDDGLPCIIKVYDEEEKSGFILNDRIEIVGFLSLNPALEADCENQDLENKALNPPPSLVPRIHAIKIKKLNHNNPLLKQITSYDDIAGFVESTRNDLHLILTALLFEDTLAADFMICHLLSRIYIRDDINTIGKLSLNLFSINLKNFAVGFYDILRMLVTNSHFVPLSTNLLNEKCFVPRKDYESNRLRSGMLQLSDDVHLVLDETQMNEGQLNNVGCLNVAAIQRLLRDQEIQYDFGYYPVRYETDIPILIISEGKSMFEADVRLKVKSDHCSEADFNESVKEVLTYLNNDVLNKIRIYLTSLRLLDFELGEEMMCKISKDYVLLRQEDREMSSADLHRLLILSRLLALSHGRTVLTPKDWIDGVEMETERKTRLRFDSLMQICSRELSVDVMEPSHPLEAIKTLKHENNKKNRSGKDERHPLSSLGPALTIKRNFETMPKTGTKTMFLEGTKEKLLVKYEYLFGGYRLETKEFN